MQEKTILSGDVLHKSSNNQQAGSRTHLYLQNLKGLFPCDLHGCLRATDTRSLVYALCS